MKAMCMALAALIGAATNSRADDAADFMKEIVLFTETALQSSGYFVGEVDGVCDEALASAIDLVLVEEDKVVEGHEGCGGVVGVHHTMAQRVGPDIALALGLRVLTPADIDEINAACPPTFGMPEYVGHPVAGVAAILRATKPFLIEDIHKPDWRWDESGEPATEEQKANLPGAINCWENNLVRLWKEARNG
jgi:hypothetical protein